MKLLGLDVGSWADLVSGTVTAIGLILTRITVRDNNKVKLVFDVSKGYRVINMKGDYLRINYIIKITNISNAPIMPIEIGYVTKRNFKKVYMPLITDKVDDKVQPFDSMERGSQVALVEDMLQNAGFEREDKNYKVRAYVMLNTGKRYYSDETIVFNTEKLDRDGEKVSDLIAAGWFKSDDLLPNDN